jgi:hypothetical protein
MEQVTPTGFGIHGGTDMAINSSPLTEFSHSGKKSDLKIHVEEIRCVQAGLGLTPLQGAAFCALSPAVSVSRPPANFFQPFRLKELDPANTE